jgi:hypothetical protein
MVRFYLIRYFTVLESTTEWPVTDVDGDDYNDDDDDHYNNLCDSIIMYRENCSLPKMFVFKPAVHILVLGGSGRRLKLFVEP